jgi:hypothetical protein
VLQTTATATRYFYLVSAASGNQPTKVSSANLSLSFYWFYQQQDSGNGAALTSLQQLT